MVLQVHPALEGEELSQEGPHQRDGQQGRDHGRDQTREDPNQTSPAAGMKGKLRSPVIYFDVQINVSKAAWVRGFVVRDCPSSKHCSNVATKSSHQTLLSFADILK